MMCDSTTASQDNHGFMAAASSAELLACRLCCVCDSSSITGSANPLVSPHNSALATSAYRTPGTPSSLHKRGLALRAQTQLTSRGNRSESVATEALPGAGASGLLGHRGLT